MFTPTGEHREPWTSSYILPRADFEVRTPSLPLIGCAEQLTGNHISPCQVGTGLRFLCGHVAKTIWFSFNTTSGRLRRKHSISHSTVCCGLCSRFRYASLVGLQVLWCNGIRYTDTTNPASICHHQFSFGWSGDRLMPGWSCHHSTSHRGGKANKYSLFVIVQQ